MGDRSDLGGQVKSTKKCERPSRGSVIPQCALCFIAPTIEENGSLPKCRSMDRCRAWLLDGNSYHDWGSVVDSSRASVCWRRARRRRHRAFAPADPRWSLRRSRAHHRGRRRTHWSGNDRCGSGNRLLFHCNQGCARPRRPRLGWTRHHGAWDRATLRRPRFLDEVRARALATQRGSAPRDTARYVAGAQLGLWLDWPLWHRLDACGAYGYREKAQPLTVGSDVRCPS